jgi:hypothetical protein
MKKLLIVFIISTLILLGILFLSSCRKESNIQPKFPLNDTEWILYQYMVDGQSVIFYRNDTLKFLDSTYTYNNNIEYYSLYHNPNNYNLILHGMPFGDISGIVADNFILYGEITGNKFSDIYSSKVFYLWLKKL